MTKTAYITVGISASGKSTWAKEMIAERIHNAAPVVIDLNRDQVRWHIMETKGLTPSWANWKWKWEDEVTKQVNNAKAFCIEKGFDMIFSDTNLNKTRVDQLTKELQDHGYQVEVKIFEVDYDEAVRRDAARKDGVGPWVIAKQLEQFEATWGTKKVAVDVSLPSCILVDIDGTVALMNGRSPFEWDRVDEDVSHEIVVSIVKGLQAQGKKIIFFSGRDGSCFEKTRNWLSDRFNSVELFMRKPGDMRNDAIVKEEMYFEHIHGKYQVEAVIDDRPRVCKMWRSLGFNVIQIGNPYVDF